jgi:hypothetical protein
MAVMRRWVGVFVALGVAWLGCGGGGGNTFACLAGSGTSRLCIETTTNVAGPANCGAGMPVAACPRDGADGACVHSFATGGASIAQTIWYYSGTAAETSQEMSDCVNNGGVWHQP